MEMTSLTLSGYLTGRSLSTPTQSSHTLLLTEGQCAYQHNQPSTPHLPCLPALMMLGWIAKVGVQTFHLVIVFLSIFAFTLFYYCRKACGGGGAQWLLLYTAKKSLSEVSTNNKLHRVNLF